MPSHNPTLEMIHDENVMASFYSSQNSLQGVAKKIPIAHWKPLVFDSVPVVVINTHHYYPSLDSRYLI